MKSRHTKIAISLPTETLEKVEKLRDARDITRSALILEAIEDKLRQEQDRADDEQFRRAHQELPETAEDLLVGGTQWDETLKEYPWG